MFKRGIGGPIWALFFISLGGLLLHIRIHPVSEKIVDPAEVGQQVAGGAVREADGSVIVKEAEYLIPLIVGIITTLALPFMFNCEKTVRWAFLINVVVVIVGTVTMANHSYEHWGGKPVTFLNIILKSTFPDIMILLAKLPLGCAILSHFHSKGQPVD